MNISASKIHVNYYFKRNKFYCRLNFYKAKTSFSCFTHERLEQTEGQLILYFTFRRNFYFLFLKLPFGCSEIICDNFSLHEGKGKQFVIR